MKLANDTSTTLATPSSRSETIDLYRSSSPACCFALSTSIFLSSARADRFPLALICTCAPMPATVAAVNTSSASMSRTHTPLNPKSTSILTMSSARCSAPFSGWRNDAVSEVAVTAGAASALAVSGGGCSAPAVSSAGGANLRSRGRRARTVSGTTLTAMLPSPSLTQMSFRAYAGELRSTMATSVETRCSSA